MLFSSSLQEFGDSERHSNLERLKNSSAEQKLPKLLTPQGAVAVEPYFYGFVFALMLFPLPHKKPRC